MHATFTDSKNRVACPASLEHGDLLNPGQIHYASRRQIEKFGLCKKCRKRIKKHGKAILKGKVETPAEILAETLLYRNQFVNMTTVKRA